MKKTPKLRFPEFSGEWEEKKSSNIFDKVRNSVNVEESESYKQIGIRSHGKGIFYKDKVTGKELGNKRVFWVEPNVFIVNIVFAWERAVTRTTENEIGMIASHRFPMYKAKEGILDLDYITYFFKTNKGKALLELASPGGAGRIKTL
jgi:type I restriction enzyme S subunit